MANPLTIFRASMGLNIKVDPTRIAYDKETGVQDLAVAFNVDHDQTGRINRRKGYAATARTETVQSMWCDGGPCLFVTGSSLCSLAADFTYTALATVTQGAKIDYEQVGDKTFWLNGYEKGQIANNENNAWVTGTYHGPETKRQLSDPPIGTIVAAHSGHMYIAKGEFLFFSEPFSFSTFDLSRGFLPLGSQIRMVRPVADGIYVGTHKAVYFLSGNDPKKFTLNKVLSSPVIKGTDQEIDLSNISWENLRQNQTGHGAIFTCKAGICLGLPNGQVHNLTHKKLTERSALSGSGLVIGDRYIALLNP
jgi:hypothetical protein